jgi:aminopeptidase N
MRGRALPVADRAADILRFYASLVGDCPYPTLTLAVVERELPGGHSPAYLAVLSQPAPSTPYTWQSDPTTFAEFPEFFLAHEIAHQWWGQAVGWKNYHEQWLSEGLSQYFAALYAEQLRGKAVFGGIVGRLQDWAMKKSGEGPVYLGYRIGHVKSDPQLFRAIVYNKSAAVLHMLRRLLGDDAFFRGLRRFYQEWRFRKAGSDDLRLAFEAESHRPLARFFERWIYDSRLPSLAFSSRTEHDVAGGRDTIVVRFEQAGDLFDVPVTVTLDYVDRPAVDVVVAVTDAVTEMRIPLDGRLRSVDVNRDRAALARIEKK